MSQDRLQALDLAYARFNASRTLGDVRESQFRIEPFGTAIATIDANRRATYYNRIVGLNEATLDTLDAMLALHADAGTESRVDAAEQASAAVEAALRARGFQPSLRLAWLEAASPFPDPATSARVERWSHEDVDRFLDLLGPVSDEIRALRREHYCTDRFRAYVASVDGAPVAWATLFVHGDMGLLGNAMTQDGFRRRGLHRALLNARLHDAERLGLAWVVSDVEPGTASHRNCERAGLRPLSVQTIWERPVPRDPGEAAGVQE